MPDETNFSEARNAQFDIMARRYAIDEFNVVHQFPKSVLLQNISHVLDPNELQGKTVLEVGAGCSTYLALFLEFGASRLLANDLFEKRLKLNAIDDPRYVAVPGDFLETDFGENEVDVIFARMTYMYLVQLFAPMLKKSHRVLKRGGLLVTMDPNYLCPLSWWRYARERRDIQPARLFNPFRLARTAEANGFAVDRLVPFTTNYPWATGHWLLGTSFGMRAVKGDSRHLENKDK
jgi:SAM-dependent methyltransferase